MARRCIVKIFSRRYSKGIPEHRYTISYLFAEDRKPAEAEDLKKKESEVKVAEVQKPKKTRPKYLVAVHCGCHKPSLEKHIKAAIDLGYKTLENTGKSIEAVEATCRYMESNPVFNCGKGSALTINGLIEMEASVMEGETMRSGAISGLTNIEHPVTLARMLMDKTPHNAIAGEGANAFAQSLGFPRVPVQTLITDEEKKAFLTSKGEVVDDNPGMAAVIALDPEGNLATAMSNGGMRRKLPGRVGSCALVGTAYYADNNVAAVTTNDNSAIVRANLAFDIAHTIGTGIPPLEAAQKALMKLQLRLYKKGTAMVVTKNGDIAIALTTDKNEWGFKRDNEYKYGNTEGYYEYKGSQ